MTEESIKKTDNIMEVINKHPETYHLFILYGIHCLGCAFSSFETVEQGAQAHGLNADELVKALNEKVKQHQKEQQEKETKQDEATEI